MKTELEIMTRIAILKARKEANGNIIAKLERELRRIRGEKRDNA